VDFDVSPSQGLTKSPKCVKLFDVRILNVGFVLVFVLLWAMVLQLLAQDLAVSVSKGDICFVVDHAGFRDSSGRTKETFLCEIAYDQLHFTREGERFRARAELTAILYDGKGNQVVGDNWDKTYEVKDYAATVSAGNPLVETFSFLMDPGRYRLHVELVDQKAGSKGTWQGDVVVPDLSPGQARFSELIFLTRPLPTKQEGPVLDSARLNPSRVFPDSVPTLRWFFAVYGPTPPGAQLLFTATGGRGVRPVSKTRPLKAIPGHSVRELQDSLSLSFSEGGSYLLALSLVDSAGKTLAGREASFEYDPFYGLVARTFEEALDILGYIASSSELDSLRKSPPSGRREAWESFWRKRDPTKGTDRNEDREQFFQRVAYANANFSRFRRGWKADMGRVYIKFDAPDEVERHPFDAENPAYEVWYYYALNRQFLFVDRHGLGDYTLSNWGAYIKK